MKGFDNRADLIGCDDGAVKLVRVIGEVFIKLQPPYFTCLPVPFVNIETLLDLAATRSDMGCAEGVGVFSQKASFKEPGPLLKKLPLLRASHFNKTRPKIEDDYGEAI
jgi:hypothetical protein